MKQKTPRQPIWLPLAISLAIVAGLFIGSRISPGKYNAENDRKLNAILSLISQDYVDSTNLNDLIEMSIPEILSNLDPHTSYISADEMKATSEGMNGTMSDIGIQFEIIDDTVRVVEVAPGGPGAKAGMLIGDRIVSIDSVATVGKKINRGKVMKCLHGPKGSKVVLNIRRPALNKNLTITATRGTIRTNAVDAHYMVDKNTGYVKVNQFGRNTYEEFMAAMESLKQEGAKRYMIDLRGNGVVLSRWLCAWPMNSCLPMN